MARKETRTEGNIVAEEKRVDRIILSSAGIGIRDGLRSEHEGVGERKTLR